ncbi:MAG: hypothetical protein JWQ90_1108 [Hydrocarboniphaga sp.]|uniref:hypothetical protein n=1 Tax=Hydrocarboniphaga sp. TaxID=2033016 RepID=UPI0026348FA9|nr:hypothetical protein [Hydrocarboniphaga sp.]MDB5968658.1 hypothetical protein [Hydrocarboniphaga sp.]
MQNHNPPRGTRSLVAPELLAGLAVLPSFELNDELLVAIRSGIGSACGATHWRAPGPEPPAPDGTIAGRYAAARSPAQPSRDSAHHPGRAIAPAIRQRPPIAVHTAGGTEVNSR